MAIPLTYNIKNVVVRWNSSFITALTIGLAVFILAISFAVREGLEEARKNVGSSANILVLQEGTRRFPSSFLSKETFYLISSLSGIKSQNQLVLAAPEIVSLMNTPRSLGATNQAFVRLRGVHPQIAQFQKNITITKGRIFRTGLNEIMIGQNLADKFPQLEVGKEIELGQQNWKVVGHFTALGPGYDIEIWVDVEQALSNFKMNSYNAIVVTLEKPENFDKVKKELEENKAFKVSVYQEKAYYESRIDGTIQVFQFLAILIFSLMSIAGFFSTINTMYGMVSSRTQEIATLRAIGFSKIAIYFCIIIESCFITFCGGIIGILLLIPLNNFSITKWQTLSEISYNITITPKVVFFAIGVSLVLGVIGGFLPAWTAARLKVAEVLRK